MTLELLEPGLLTLVQATPYRGTRHLGMPLAGAADPVAMALANWLVGNGPETAALETAYAPLSFRANRGCVVGVQGAAINIEINGNTVFTHQSVILASGDVLTISPPPGGCRSYVAIRGGIADSGALKATSTYLPARLGGHDGTTIPKEYVIEANAATSLEPRELPAAYRLRYGMDFMLRVADAPESGCVVLDALTGTNRTVGRRADRIGLELEGAPLKPQRTEPLDSSAVFPGTIQCPPSGQPFLLGPDAQTTGGYPRIAQVIRADRHLIGQLRPGAHIRFQHIEPAEARRLYRSKIELIRQLQPDFRLD